MKAQLIVVGGRPIPNALTIIHDAPDILVAMCSIESINDEWLQLKPAIEKLSPTTYIEEPIAIDAYAVEAITEACKQAILTHPDAEWVVNVTTGTSLMTLGAYIAAEFCSSQKSIQVRCWYMDTANSRVISLVGKGRDSGIFSIGVEDYIVAHNYKLQDAASYKNWRARYLQDDWMTFASRLGKNPLDADLLKAILAKRAKNKFHIIQKSDIVYRFLRDMENIKLVNKLEEKEDCLSCYISEEQHHFLNGAWLELYVYQEALLLGKIFDDVKWSKEIIDNDPKRQAKSPFTFNDMDVSLTHKARLMLIECKTENDTSTKLLDGLVTMTDLVGRGFVIKVLVMSQISEESIKEDFLVKARAKGVKLVTKEKLSQIGTILEEILPKAKQR